MENNTKIIGDHSEGIDGIRAFCCIAIVAWHVLANGGFQIGGFAVEKIIPSWNDLVYLFMIISGFGMCCGYYERIKENRISMDDFYKRRYSKIFPFFAMLIILDIIIEHSLESVAEGFLELTLVFGFLPNNQLNVIGVAWTLGVIFVFYIVFPFVVFLMSNKRRAWLTFGLSIVIQILCQVYFMTDKFVGTNFIPKHSFLYCVPFFLAGCLVYLYKETVIKWVVQYSHVYGIICGAATILYYVIPHKIGILGINELLVLFLYTLWLGYAISTTNRLLCNKGTKFISGISMEIYLSHMVCFRVIEKLGFTRLVGNGVLSYICVVGVVLIVLMVMIPIIQKVLNQISGVVES